MIDREHGAKVIAVACGAAVLTLGGLFLLSGGSGTGSAAGADTVTAEQGPVAYEDRDIPLFRTQLTQETIPIRFYDDMPNIAYVKIEDYHHIFLPEDQVTVEETADGTGVYNVANGSGSAVIDTVEETIESDDLICKCDGNAAAGHAQRVSGRTCLLPLGAPGSVPCSGSGGTGSCELWDRSAGR